MTYKSSVDKFFDCHALAVWAQACGAAEDDLMLVMSGPKIKPWKHWVVCVWRWAIAWV